MEILLNKAKINRIQLRQFIIRITAEELSSLSEPCYYPALKKYYFDLLKLTGLNERDIIDFFSNLFKGTKAPEGFLLNDETTNLLIFIMHYFLINKDDIGYSATMLYHMIRQYSNLMHRRIAFCQPEAFKYALDNISKTHLFAREKTIPNAIYFLSKEMIRLHTDHLLNAEPDGIFAMVYLSRHRLSQSLRSFAELYYKAAKEGLGYKTQEEAPEESETERYQKQESDRSKMVAERVIQSIVVYKNIDKSAIEDAKKVTRININLANQLANKLVDMKYSDDIRIIVELFVKDLSSVSELCGSKFLPYTRSLMSLKRTTKQIYFKKQVNDLTIKLVKDIGYYDKFESLTNQTQFLISAFVAFYIAIVTRHLVCGQKKIEKIATFRIY